MEKRQIITCKPDVASQDGQILGCYYSVVTYENENENEYEALYWIIYSDGTYEESGDIYYEDDCPEHWGCKGTFDKSKYDEFVRQMQSFQTDWQKELCEDETTSWHFNC